MIIAIASGKGGTGKTTIACNLAAGLEKPVTLLDCDVEQPNAHLFLQPRWTGSELFHLDVPEIDAERCSLCGACQELCQFNAIAILPEIAMTFPELCHSCRGCALVCQEEAIGWSKRLVGEVRWGCRGMVSLVEGRLRVGEAMAPPLIEQVRKHQGLEGELTLIDAPPGTSCPVVASLWGADFALLVTEPTPFGLNDLELAVGAVRKLGLPMGLVINRCDIGDRRVHRFAEQQGIPILLEMPFDKKTAEAYARGSLLVEVLPQWKEAMVQLYEKILETLRSWKAAC
ncbi:MinD superfamily P-loop ATPase, contains an inserted ferredoxin domain [Desulfacinum hydrothermale DSM 13146]|uniref:MinD superfamily P-loop ATPase, contains an inserted ferredoxin domain n=1 Tax=Desulfacinum hydrothermale DSM 13146 TaxID=1121390 RepID=A0A1W1WXU4_9BACT|nr:ATP-binding protein [Desulfacinum hydrothermale]SMC16485.1 MinD superfamily P-loop ATPase, contains an inserted ferredoxin domain [Desulfacinum hydrothermale DSM 13146]